MVRALHDAEIEVILDVVYNHTAEGNHMGPTLSMRGYRQRRLLPAGRRRQPVLHGLHRHRQQPQRRPPARAAADHGLVAVLGDRDARRRLPLRPGLHAGAGVLRVDKLSTFFELVQQDPTVSQVKLIAEPWDVGPGGYQVGNFPPQWTEWNGKYRDTVRDFWRGEDASLGEFASRLTGSADLYEHTAPPPGARRSTSSPRTTGSRLRDLVSYTEKHNEANGEGNRDGESNNQSWNCGAEGPTDDPEVNALRARQQRNFLITPLLSQGVPMICSRRRTRPNPGRQQQRILPGQRDHLGGLEARRRRSDRVHPDGIRASPRASGVPPAPVLRRSAGPSPRF